MADGLVDKDSERVDRALSAGGLAALLLVGGLWIHHSAYEGGKLAERRDWQKVATKAKDLAISLAEERQGRKDDAASARAARDAAYNKTMQPIHDEVIRYVKEPIAAERCLTDDGVRLGQSAIDAANRSLAGSGPAGK
jgi:hypothetical protein